MLKLSGAGIGACAKVTDADLVEMCKLDEEAIKRIESSVPKRLSLPPKTTITNVIQRQYDLKREEQLEVEMVVQVLIKIILF